MTFTIILIGNYLPDKQESMLRFQRMLERGLEQREQPLISWNPPVYWVNPEQYQWGKKGQSIRGYLDKYAVGFRDLKKTISRARSQGPVVAHIVDHSNAMYVSAVQSVPHLVTIHDLLAVRGAFGEDTDCPASRLGYLLQKWIWRGLRRSQRVITDSTATQNDFIKLGGNADRSEMIPIGLNSFFRVLPVDQINEILPPILPGCQDRPYLFHVGSNLKRKNKEGILRIFARIKDQWGGDLVFAGPPLSSSLQALARQLGVLDRVKSVVNPTDAQLEALYNGAFALLFPSRFEGFGWPIIEAQACGCPVVCSDQTSLPEVVGEGGIVFPIADEAKGAEAVLKLTDPTFRNQLIKKGLENVQRFTAERMVEDYLKIYQELIQGKNH